MKIAQLFAGLLLCGALAACGGGSSGSSSGTLTVSPASATVAAGSTQLYTVTNGSGDIITWQVNGITGGNSTVGTISSGGLYKAPAVPPVSQPVSITAMQDSNTGSATATVTYSNASLNGQFVFTFSEQQGGVSTNVVGLITADGDGNVSGTEDVNGPLILPPSIAVTGNYTLSANGQGILTLNGGVTLNLTLTLVAGAAQGILTDNTMGRVGGGSLFPMTGVVNSASDLGGNYTIDLGANPPTTNDNSIGYLTLTAPNITGSTDENNAGTVTTFNTVTGSYTIGSGNRGTLTLTINGVTTFDYVIYAVSPNQLELMCTDPGCSYTGEMNTQTSQAVAAGNYAFSLVGSGIGGSPDALLITGTMVPGNGGGAFSNLTIYENNNGFYQSIISATTYTVTNTGRGQINIQTPSGVHTYTFYVSSPGYLYMLETTLNQTIGNTSGFAVATQSNATAVSGQYLLYTVGQAPSSSALSTIQATLHVASSGQVAGQEVLNNNGTIMTIPVSGTLAASQAAGTYTLQLNLGGGQTASYIMAAVAPGELLPIRTDSTEVSVGGMFIQYTSP